MALEVCQEIWIDIYNKEFASTASTIKSTMLWITSLQFVEGIQLTNGLNQSQDDIQLLTNGTITEYQWNRGH